MKILHIFDWMMWKRIKDVYVWMCFDENERNLIKENTKDSIIIKHS